MKYLWVLLVFSLILVSCLSGESREAVCRHKAVIAALIYGEHYPVRIVYGPTDNQEYHCQAQALIDGNWEFLDITPSQVFVSTGKQDNFTIIAQYGVKKFLDIFWFQREPWKANYELSHD